MAEISRRLFLRNASVGVAAAGAVAAGGTTLFSTITSADAAGAPLLSSADTPTVEGSGILAHVVDAKTGQLSILVGTREINFVNVDLAQQLMRAAR